MPLMSRALGTIAAVAVIFLAVAAGVWLLRNREAPPADPAAVLEQVREVARLEAIQLSLHKKISFEPNPKEADSWWGDVSNWMRFTVQKPRGRAIVFAEVDLGVDLKQLGPSSLKVDGRRAEIVLPALQADVRLLPGETEIIDSNLDSEETAQLFEKAKEGFEREVMADRALQRRAREAHERALRGLLFTLGFREVVFVERIPPAPNAG